MLDEGVLPCTLSDLPRPRPRPRPRLDGPGLNGNVSGICGVSSSHGSHAGGIHGACGPRCSLLKSSGEWPVSTTYPTRA